MQQINDPVSAETLTGVAVIASLDEALDATDIVTRIYPRGSGNGSAIATLAAATSSAPGGFTLDKVNNCLVNNTAESTYGRIDRFVDFKDIGPLSNTTVDVQNASNMLLIVSINYLLDHAQPISAYTISLAGVNNLLQPGTTIRVVYRKLIDSQVAYDLDAVFNIVEVDQALDETGLRTDQIVVSTRTSLPQTDAKYMADQAQSARAFAAHPQLSASVDNFSFRDEMDNSHAASLRFWLGDEYTTIQRAILRFRIQPLRSTVKSSAASSGGGSTQTSAGGGSGTWTATNVITWGNANSTIEIPSGSDHYHGIGSTMHSHPVTIPSHTHDVTFPDHSHTINISYGIFEDSGSNTLALTDLVITLNGGADLRSVVTDIGNGWYQLDITSTLVNSIYRPNQTNNEVLISTATAKTARIEAQITIRGVVQAVQLS